jgi:hypothetical protein
MRAASKSLMFAGAALAAAAGLLSNGNMPSSQSGFVSGAEARIGRPLTPMSYAGVARRTTRRAVAVGAAGAAAAGAYYYTQPGGRGCVQVVNAYGQLQWQCP